jgi:hypothetical protein
MLLIKIIQKTKVIAPISGMAGSLLVLLLLGNYFFLYFEFGMIEPIAVLFLISLYYFAQTKSTVGIIGSGITTLLLRMDYAGAVLASLILTSMPIYGSFQEACGQILVWLKSRWLQLAGQILVLFLPAVSIIAAYNIQASNYKLKDGDTTHKNIASILEGFLRVIIGGNFAEIKTQFLNMPVFTVATTIILISGTLLGLAALFWRFKILKYVDFRMSLVILLFLSVYVIVRPTGYPPRFSTPLLPISILILASFINQVWKNKHQHFEGEL